MRRFGSRHGYDIHIIRTFPPAQLCAITVAVKHSSDAMVHCKAAVKQTLWGSTSRGRWQKRCRVWCRLQLNGMQLPAICGNFECLDKTSNRSKSVHAVP